jgi:hypothetical protein
MILHVYRLKMGNLEGTRYKAGAQQQDVTTGIAMDRFSSARPATARSPIERQSVFEPGGLSLISLEQLLDFTP